MFIPPHHTFGVISPPQKRRGAEFYDKQIKKPPKLSGLVYIRLKQAIIYANIEEIRV